MKIQIDYSLVLLIANIDAVSIRYIIKLPDSSDH
jgi:hypothetical protein